MLDTMRVMPDSKRPYPHTIQTVHPEFQRRSQRPMSEPMPNEDEKGLAALVLKKLDDLASKEILQKLQGQMVDDKNEIMTSIEGLRGEMVREVSSLRTAQDVTNVAVSAVTERVKKLEIVRSVPPRNMSPAPQRYDLGEHGKSPKGGVPTEEAQKLVDRLNELEPFVKSLSDELAVMQAEKDEAKRKADEAAASERIAQERQAAVQKYAMDLEKESKAKRKMLLKLGYALLPIAVSIGGYIAHLLHL
jgi:hypothetical protein